jgi:penicillin amidase
VEEGRAALAQARNSSWNWVLADRAGSIGYQMSGNIPLRREGITGLVPLPGWDPANDWGGFAAPEDLPCALDPPEGFLATANDDLNALCRLSPINLPMGRYRAERIRAVLARGSRLRPEDMKELQFDLYSTQAERFMEVLRPLLSDSPAGRLLSSWDLTYRPDSREAFQFERFYRCLIEEVFGRGAEGARGLGQDVISYLFTETSVFIDFYENFDRVLLSERSAWFGGRARPDVYRAALARALEGELATYGAGRQIVLKHILLRGKLPRVLGFDRGPIGLRGGRATVHQGQIYRSGGRDTSFGPGLRLVADLATDELQTTQAGGPSDRRFSKWYTTSLAEWEEGRYKALQGRAKNLS